MKCRHKRPSQEGKAEAPRGDKPDLATSSTQKDHTGSVRCFSSKLLNRHFIKSCRIWKGVAVSKKSKLQEIKVFKKTVIVYLLAGQWVAFLG